MRRIKNQLPRKLVGKQEKMFFSSEIKTGDTKIIFFRCRILFQTQQKTMRHRTKWPTRMRESFIQVSSSVIFSVLQQNLIRKICDKTFKMKKNEVYMRVRVKMAYKLNCFNIERLQRNIVYFAHFLISTLPVLLLQHLTDEM